MASHTPLKHVGFRLSGDPPPFCCGFLTLADSDYATYSDAVHVT